MPSRDPTGKRLAGNAVRKRAAARKLGAPAQVASQTKNAASASPGPPQPASQELPVPAVFRDLPAPPTRGVSAVEAWAAGVNLRAGVGLSSASPAELPRLLSVASIARELGRLKDKAARAEKALTLRRLRLREPDAIDLGAPPFDDPIAIVLWAFHRLAALAHEAACLPSWRLDERLLASVKALAASGFLPCNQELRAVAERSKKAG